jgi:hypothetical protein
VRKGYGKNCLHRGLEVLNDPVPPPSTPSSRVGGPLGALEGWRQWPQLTLTLLGPCSPPPSRYVQSAMRAVNQAVGRVIRHKDDYGAIIFADQRFADTRLHSQMSLWLRPFVKNYPKFGAALSELTGFFRYHAAEQVGLCRFLPTGFSSKATWFGV